MTRWIERAGLILLLLAALLCLWAILRALRAARNPLHTCPGSRSSLFSPLRLLLASRCGYDLASLRPANGARTCPECGTVSLDSISPQRPLPRLLHAALGGGNWAGSRPRLIPLALAFTALGLAAHNFRTLRQARWAPYAPTPVLLAVADAFPQHTPGRILDELADRAGSRWWPLNHWLNAIAIESLGHDTRRYNASWAQSVLSADFPASAPALHAALHDPDYQRRQLAALLLAHRDPLSPPTDAQLDTAVEGLADDRLRSVGTDLITNERLHAAYLLRHAARAAPRLLAVLDSPDDQQSLIAAAVLVAAGLHTEPAARTLIRHLADNTRDYDALRAFHALWYAGPRVLPILEHALAAGTLDDQAERSAELLARKLRGEVLSSSQTKALNAISTVTHDPASDHTWIIDLFQPPPSQPPDEPL